MEMNDAELREQGKPLYNKTSFPGYDKIAAEQQKKEKQKQQNFFVKIVKKADVEWVYNLLLM